MKNNKFLVENSSILTFELGVLAPPIKQLTEATLQAELKFHLTCEINKNHNNSKPNKIMKSSVC